MSSCKPNNRNVEIYYEKINSAELKIIEGDYSNALDTYEDAFNEFNSPWALDYYNAFLCSLKANNNLKASNYFDSCIIRGVPDDYIFNIFSKDWIAHNIANFEQHYDSLRAIYLNSFNDSILKIFDFSFEKDQSFAFGFMNQSIDGLDYYDVVLRNIDTLTQIMENNLLPKYAFKYAQYPRMENVPWVTIRHYFGLRNSIREGLLDSIKYQKYYNKERFFDNKFENLLIAQIKSGRVCPTQYTSTVTYNLELKNQFGNESIIQIGKECYSKSLSQNEKNNITKNRQKVFLENYDDYIKKYNYLVSLQDTTTDIVKGNFRFRVNHRSTKYALTGEALEDVRRDFIKAGYIKLE
jgi:hypothetical protein